MTPTTPSMPSPMSPARPRPWATLVCALLTLLLGASCGGVGQDGTGAAPPDSQSTGVVNGFGSVIVNGVRYDVGQASISIDGVPGASQADLRVGMVVTVTGSLSADETGGTATRIDYESLLRGNVDEAPSGLSIRVLGQPVQVDQTTVFQGATGLDDLRPGDRLQVSGFRDPSGGLRATFVQRESGTILQFSGFVSAAAGGTLQVAGLAIDISRATQTGFGGAAPSVGQFVRIRLEAAPAAGGAMASSVTRVDFALPASVRRQQVQGIVSAWDAAAGRLQLNGQTVQVDAQTRLQDGTLAELAAGRRVEVRGTRNADGVLQAERLTFYRTLLTAYGRGKVTQVNLAERRFNVLALPGIEVRLRDDTLLNDRTGVPGTVLNLANLLVDDEVLVLGRADGDSIEANLVQRLPRSTPGVGVGGAVTGITGTTLSVLGVNVGTATADFFDAQGQALTQAAFFAALQLGDEVRAEGLYLGGAVVARTVRRVR